MPDASAGGVIPDLIKIDLPAGTRVFVVSDMHLRPTRNAASSWSAPAVARVLEEWEGDGIVVLAGDLLEMWFVQPPDPRGSLKAHPELARAISSFADSDGRRVIYLIGNHDGRLGWDRDAQGVVTEALHAELAFAAELSVGGSKAVRIEHGHAYDPANAFQDPRNPGDTPLGEHVVEEILPSISFADEGWLKGLDSLADPRTFPDFLTSRLFYRRVLRDAKWLLLPIALFLIVRIPVTYILFLGHGHHVLPKFTANLVVFDLGFLLFLAIVGAIALVAVRRAWKTASSVVATKRGSAQNDNTRDAARSLIDKEYAGMVCGHTHRPELSEIGSGFYANTGSCTQVVDSVEARFQMPHVFLPRIQLTWVELEAGDPWRVRLIEGRREVPGSTLAERRMEKNSRSNVRPDPAVVGVYPGGPFRS